VRKTRKRAAFGPRPDEIASERLFRKRMESFSAGLC
jgi:hypothetical protein